MNWGERYEVEDSGIVCVRGFTFLVWPKLFTRSLRVHTGNMLIPCMFSRHKTYGKLSWSRDVKRTTSLNQAHMKWFGAGVSSLTITEASARAENQTGKFIISDLLHSSQIIYRNIQQEHKNNCLRKINKLTFQSVQSFCVRHPILTILSQLYLYLFRSSLVLLNNSFPLIIYVTPCSMFRDSKCRVCPPKKSFQHSYRIPSKLVFRINPYGVPCLWEKPMSQHLQKSCKVIWYQNTRCCPILKKSGLGKWEW